MPSIDFQQLKRCVPLRDVLRLLDWQPRVKVGGQLYGPCPLCLESRWRRGCFAVKGDSYFCLACRSGGDQLRLYMELRKLPLYEACRELCQQIGLAVPYLPRRRTRR